MKRALRRMTLTCVGVALAGLFFEAGVRLLIPVSDFFWEGDPVTGMKLIPGKRGRFIKAGLFDVPVEVNSHGFRDREHSREKAPGTKRIVLLGDSYLEALQVPFEKSLTARLERHLLANGLDVEVINLAVSSFGTGREYLAFREYGLRYEPDVTLLFFVGNDVENNSQRLEGIAHFPYPVMNGGRLVRDAEGRPRFTPIVDTSGRLALVTGILKNYSKSYRLLRGTVESSPRIHGFLYRAGLMGTSLAGSSEPGDLGIYEIYRVVERPILAQAWRVTEELILEVDRLARASGGRFGVVLIPAPWEVYQRIWDDIGNRVPAIRSTPLDVDKPSRRLKEFLHSHGIPHLDLLPLFRGRAASSPSLFFEGDSHWTAEGHGAATEPVAALVKIILRDVPSHIPTKP